MILEKDVYLIKRIDEIKNDEMKHLKALYFIRPTENNLSMLLE